jgi:hypothetical protein
MTPRVIAYRTARGVTPSISAAVTTLTRCGCFAMIASCRLPAGELYAWLDNESRKKLLRKIKRDGCPVSGIG